MKVINGGNLTQRKSKEMMCWTQAKPQHKQPSDNKDNEIHNSSFRSPALIIA